MQKKPLWKLIVFLIAFTLEVGGIAAGFLYLAFYVPQFYNTRELVLYVGLPFMLILACIVVCPNISYHFHPEEEQEQEESEQSISYCVVRVQTDSFTFSRNFRIIPPEQEESEQ